MEKSKCVLEALLNLITKSCGIIACYAAVVTLIIFFPVRSLANHNIHAQLTSTIFYPAAVILSVICMVQLLVNFNNELKEFTRRSSRAIFGTVGFLVMVFLGMLAVVMPFFALSQLVKS